MQLIWLDYNGACLLQRFAVW